MPPAAAALKQLALGGGGHVAEAAVRAGAVQALVRQLSTIDDDAQLDTAAATLMLIAHGAGQQAAAAAGTGCVPALLRCLPPNGRSHRTQAVACLALAHVLATEEMQAAFVSQNGVQSLARCLRCQTDRSCGSRGGDPCMAAVDALLLLVPKAALDLDAAFAAAGVIPVTLEILQDSRSAGQLRGAAMNLLSNWCLDSPDRCQAALAAGGAAALACCMRRRDSDELVDAAIALLALLLFNGDVAAMAAFEHQGTCLDYFAAGRMGLEVQQAALALAARTGQELRMPAADDGPAAAAPQATPEPPRPPRVCAACGATAGLLRKCAGCRMLRYCSDACCSTHWPTHKPECLRLQAEQAAAAAAAAGASAEAAGQA